MNEPERYGTCSDGNGHWGIEDDGKVILSGLVSHDACDAVMDILDERDALKAEVERLTVSLKVSHDAINASEKVLGKHQVRECIDESVNSWGCVDLPASIKGLVRKLEVADNHAQALEMVINAGTANELRLKAEVERLTKWQPIETAPRDGTEIIGRAGLWVEVTAFFKGTKPWERKEAWVTSNDDEGYAQDFKPTHWLPLPEIPAKKGKQS